MKHLDLFSGIGGFALAARWMGWQTVGFCEIDEWCQRVLAKNFPGVPIHDDVMTYDGQECDIITAGFPCQPYSLAGKRRGAGDDRALGHEAVRLIEQCRPRHAVLENVYGFVSMGLDNLLFDLESIGYRVGAFVIPACAVDALHRRDRVWIVANANLEGSQGRGRLRERAGKRTFGPNREAVKTKWLPEPKVGRVANGVPRRVDRLRGLGNAIVPQVAHQIFRSLK